MQPKPHIFEESNIRLAGEGTAGMPTQFLVKVEVTVGRYRFELCLSFAGCC